MSFAWDTTTEDVALVLKRHGIQANADSVLDQYFDDELFARIVKQVLRCDDIDEQTEAAQEEIEIILIELGVIPKF